MDRRDDQLIGTLATWSVAGVLVSAGDDLDPTLRRRERIPAGCDQDVVGRAEPFVAVHPNTYEYIDVQKVAPRRDNCAW